MNTIKYNIKLNKYNRPYIELIGDSGNSVEDKFFAVEMVKYIFSIILTEKKKLNNNNINTDDIESFESTVETIERISDEMAIILIDHMLKLGNTVFDYVDDYHVKVNNFNELRDDLIFFQNDDKIYRKVNNLKVFVKDENTIYKFNSILNAWEPQIN